MKSSMEVRAAGLVNQDSADAVSPTASAAMALPARAARRFLKLVPGAASVAGVSRAAAQHAQAGAVPRSPGEVVGANEARLLPVGPLAAGPVAVGPLGTAPLAAPFAENPHAPAPAAHASGGMGGACKGGAGPRVLLGRVGANVPGKPSRDPKEAASWPPARPRGPGQEGGGGIPRLGGSRREIASPDMASTEAAREQQDTHREAGGSSITGRVWALSRDARGCRMVQVALSEAANDDVRAALGQELKGHVWEALRDPHANYVVQKCVATLRPQASQFIIDELLQRGDAAVVDTARHRCGCRSFQRLLEHCEAEQLSSLVEILLANAISLSKHTYGNYVMQHVLEHGSKEQRRRLVQMLEQEAATICFNNCACAVVSKAMELGEHEDSVALARAFATKPGLVTAMARSRYGHLAVRAALNLLEGNERELVCAQLKNDAASLRASRYGRAVATTLELPAQGDRPPLHQKPRAIA
eukprot:TRINITY_DN38692_c0_g1_i1.p1 TRINITY_DN38692_c0_g1~~TRINITY_DN38692_c0_g1_i1.p1  ORF type:complete len:473 (-),score=72.47 TRINITY_DN38692_c0_g1_i1:103-1521(-)